VTLGRVRDWPTALATTVEQHRTTPLIWGVSDCFTLPMDCVRAITGTDPWSDQRGYTTEFGAARKLAALDFRDVGDAFAAKLEEIPPARMGRGDIGVVGKCGVVCVGHQVIGKAAGGGLTFSPRSTVTRAFRVGG
jgi:hypothetical protein